MTDYCTAAQAKAHIVEAINSVTTYDALLASLVTRASRAVDHFTRREPNAYAAASVTRYFDGSGCDKLWIDELASAPTAVVVAETGDVDDAADSGGTYTTWATSDYLLWPYNATQYRLPYTRLDIDVRYGTKSVWYAYPKAVKITGAFGYSTSVPEEIEQATIIQVVRWFGRGKQLYMDNSAYDEVGRLTLRKLDPDVENLLLDFKRVIV